MATFNSSLLRSLSPYLETRLTNAIVPAECDNAEDSALHVLDVNVVLPTSICWSAIIEISAAYLPCELKRLSRTLFFAIPLWKSKARKYLRVDSTSGAFFISSAKRG